MHHGCCKATQSVHGDFFGQCSSTSRNIWPELDTTDFWIARNSDVLLLLALLILLRLVSVMVLFTFQSFWVSIYKPWYFRYFSASFCVMLWPDAIATYIYKLAFFPSSVLCYDVRLICYGGSICLYLYVSDDGDDWGVDYWVRNCAGTIYLYHIY